VKELRHRLWSELPQNSPNSRRRLTSVILGRFFPDKKIEQLPRRVCMAYQDDACLASVMGPLCSLQSLSLACYSLSVYCRYLLEPS